MSFARPALLGLLLVMPVLAIWILRGRRRRRVAWTALGHSGRPPCDGSWAWLGALGLLLVAVAGPRWGRVPGSEPPPGHDVVLLVDVSRSMAAEDAVPNRLGLAVEAAEALVSAIGRERGGRVAVVAFAGRGVLRCPLTENLGAVVDVLNGLEPGGVRPGGSNLGPGLAAALDAFDPDHQPEPEEGRTIVVFSDGEDHEPTWPAALPALEAERVVVHSVAVGDDQEGHPIPVVDPAEAARSVLTWQGETVETRRQDEALRGIAEATHGAFVPLGLSPPVGIDTLYRERIAPLARLTRESSRNPERVDRYRLFVLAALVVGVVGSWPGRRRPALSGLVAIALIPGAAQRQGEIPPNDPPATPLPSSGPAAEASSRVGEIIRRGNDRYARGDFAGALDAFEQAIALDPGSPLPRYNAAATLYALGRYSEAVDHYREAYALADAALRTKIDYALGNTAVALGAFDAAIEHYDACIGSPARGPSLEVIRRDAAINRAFAERYRQVESEQVPGPDPGGDRSPDSPPGREPGEPSDDPGEFQPDGGQAPPTTPTENPPPGEPGVGGTAAAQRPPGTSPEDSPRERLEQALDNIRRARGSRSTDEPLPPDPDPERKSW